MAEIVNGNIGPEATYDVSFSGGALVIAVSYKGAQASAGVNVSVSATQLLADLASKASNTLEKEAIAVVQALIAKI